MKRGLVDGLASVIKYISGNLDSRDGERYDKISGHIRDIERNLANQFNYRYSLSNRLKRNFNETIKDIRYDNFELKYKLAKLKENLDNGSRARE